MHRIIFVTISDESRTGADEIMKRPVFFVFDKIIKGLY